MGGFVLFVFVVVFRVEFVYYLVRSEGRFHLVADVNGSAHVHGARDVEGEPPLRWEPWVSTDVKGSVHPTLQTRPEGAGRVEGIVRAW